MTQQAVDMCPAHGKPWVLGQSGSRRCTFHISEIGAGEDYGCPQNAEEELLWRIFGKQPDDNS